MATINDVYLMDPALRKIFMDKYTATIDKSFINALTDGNSWYLCETPLENAIRREVEVLRNRKDCS